VKKFCSAQDIENLAAQGKTELIVDENTILTDLARHTAQQLGISIVDGSRPASAMTSTPPPVTRPTARKTVGLGGKPKGCQHGPLTGSQGTGPATATGNSNSVVDQLVGLVKRLGGR
jgi:hypothetical protein